MLKITSLVENTKSEPSFICEHGLSLLIEWKGVTILLDTGASEAFLENAELMDIDLSKLDYVVLSHGHSDHSGGVRTLCHSTRRKFKLVLNPHFFDKKFKQDGEYLRYIGNDINEEFLQIENVTTIFPMLNTFTLIEGVSILSEFDAFAAFENESSDFVALRGGVYDKDLFAEEQVLAIDHPKGFVVISGCSHRGIVNICKTIKDRLQKPVYALVGGIHLMDSSDERIERTVAFLKEEGISVLAAGHCTGAKGIACLEAAGIEVLSLSSGTVIEL